MLMGYGMLTPHLPGSAAAFAALRPGMEDAVDLKHPQAVCLSGVVVAMALSCLTPSQHSGGGAGPPFK